ncbi:c-type cytochrome [Biformimicrobium ophioploci]|uniref:cytochrome-c oxidase n=1 Tax=Biformimicrobium ophioploci TaxID=3036711 RepID=A0ABQ6LY37_9GAMM|nr:c-type cytochrome [Microbulbifer sp. NKW57]GMG86937.1 hypothetical protein MNKW57_12580 [Microbulbifer sp. NKW57]
MRIAITLLLLVIGTVAFHIWSPWWFTPLASNWHAIDTTVDITIWVTGFVFIAVNLFLAFAIYRYRKRPDQPDRKAAYEPENKKLEGWLTIITAAGVAIMLAPGLLVWSEFVRPPQDAAEFEVLGQQWHWTFRFPGEDGRLGKVATQFISEKNPFGIDPRDEAGLDDILVSDNELHLPEGKPLKALLRSKDVLHNFTVPQFRVKMDLVPGLQSFVWFTPTKPGKYEILCEELCGIAHFAMRGKVIVEPEQAFTQWLAGKPTFAQSQQIAAGDPVKGQAHYATCAACHGPNGEGNPSLKAPRLAGMSEWYLKRQIHYFREGIRGASPEDKLGQQMAPMANTLPDQQAVVDVATYLSALPEFTPLTTIHGDTRRGRHYYVTCGACHGQQGEGNFATNSPRLAGQRDWYLKQQLLNFKAGLRGTHQKDSYGHEMLFMARILTDEQAIDDVLAYINSLDGVHE